MFRRDGALHWSKETTLATGDPRSLDAFGASVALSADGETLAVGEPNASHDRSSPVYRAGLVHVFAHGESGWSPAGDLTASNPDPGDGFGVRLALSGDGRTLAVGATTEASAATGAGGGEEAQADDSAPCAGAVYLFTNDGPAWSQQAYLRFHPASPSHEVRRSDARPSRAGGQSSSCRRAGSGSWSWRTTPCCASAWSA